MHKDYLTRRGFIKKSVAAGLAVAGLSSFRTPPAYDPKGLPTVVFGRTGVRIPRIGIGLGSRFCIVRDEQKALEILEYALDNGIYYWDTSNAYVYNGIVSEERAGKILKHRRKEVFLSTKFAHRNPERASREVETSFQRLQTDHFDNLMIHNVSSVEDVEEITRKGGVMDLLERLKEEGITRYTGFSAHSDAEAARLLIERGNFDNILFAMNQYNDYSQNRQDTIIPAALEKQMGILLMKVIRPKETVPALTTQELVRFALSLDGPSSVVIGMDSIEVVRSNVDILRNFKPMNDTEKARMTAMLSPFFEGRDLEWTKPWYYDGYWT